ncbi:MAG: WbqC family protein [Leptolyngbya sp.]|nr:WbqC family protein [Candidatus Melainabacteria bacterium]
MTPFKPTKCAILQSSYLPWKGYFDLINSVDYFVFYDIVQFTKNDWRNRNKIKTAQGLQWLTIPVIMKGRLDLNIDQMVCANNEWQEKHWRSISQNYSRCKYFAEYKNVFEKFYQDNQSLQLTDINRLLIEKICQALAINTPLLNASDLKIEGDRNWRLISICKQVGADHYLSGPAAKSYLDEKLFKDNGITVEWMNFENYPEHQQRFPPFEHKVSVIDLIFNEGPHATEFLLSKSHSNLT